MIVPRYEQGRIGPDAQSFAAGWLTAGTGAVANLLAINNLAGSGRITIVAGLMARMNLTQSNRGRPITIFKATGAATGGTVIAQVKGRTSNPNAVAAVVRAATASDSGGATAISVPGGGVRLAGSLGPSGFAAFTALDPGDTNTWNLLNPFAPSPELEPGECLYLTIDANSDGFTAVDCVLIEVIGLG